MSRKYSFFNKILNFGDPELSRLDVLVENFIKAFNEFSHNKHFEIFVAFGSKTHSHLQKINRLAQLNEYPVPFKNFKHGETNCFYFHLETWGQASYNALIIGSVYFTPLGMGIKPFGLKGFGQRSLVRLCTRDAPSVNEMKELFSSHLEFNQSELKEALGTSQDAFTKHLKEEILPQWRQIELSNSWSSIPKKSYTELKFNWMETFSLDRNPADGN